MFDDNDNDREQISIKIDKALHLAIKRAARSRGMTMGAMYECALEEYLMKFQQPQPRPVQAFRHVRTK